MINMKIGILIKDNNINISNLPNNIIIYKSLEEIKNNNIYDILIELKDKSPISNNGIQIICSNYKNIDEKIFNLIEYFKNNNFLLSKNYLLGRKKDYYSNFINRLYEKSYTDSYYNLINIAEKNKKISFIIFCNNYNYEEILNQIISFFKEDEIEETLININEKLISIPRYYNSKTVYRK